MTIIVDYGMGNIASVANMIKKVGGQCTVSSDPEKIRNATRLIIPGVGSFDHGVEELNNRGLFTAIQEAAQKDIAIMGICLGMQLLGNKSEEGSLNGLSLVDADFKKFIFEDAVSLRVPHVGWNNVQTVIDNPLIPPSNEETRFYFTHSYHAVCNKPENSIVTTSYGYTFTSAFRSGRVYGVQYHPEKSHRFGMALMKRFIEL